MPTAEPPSSASVNGFRTSSSSTGQNGLDILRELRGDPDFADLPVLMLTARGQEQDRDLATRAGVSRFMTKPFSNADVLDAVRDLVAG